MVEMFVDFVLMWLAACIAGLLLFGSAAIVGRIMGWAVDGEPFWPGTPTEGETT